MEKVHDLHLNLSVLHKVNNDCMVWRASVKEHPDKVILFVSPRRCRVEYYSVMRYVDQMQSQCIGFSGLRPSIFMRDQFCQSGINLLG